MPALPKNRKGASKRKKYVKTEMKLLRDAMMDINTDVRMESDGSIGANWGSLTKFED